MTKVTPVIPGMVICITSCIVPGSVSYLVYSLNVILYGFNGCNFMTNILNIMFGVTYMLECYERDAKYFWKT